MDIIVIKQEHRKSFEHLLPVELAGCLDSFDTFALGLLQKTDDGFRPMGILVAKIESESAEILWINILPEARFMGYGVKLVQFFLNLVKGKVDTVMAFAEEESNMYFFLPNCGFDILPATRKGTVTTTVGALTGGKLGKHPTPAGIIPFSQVPAIHLRAFNHAAKERDISHEAALFPLEQKDYLPCSMAIIEKDSITGLLLFSEDKGIGGISLVFQYAAGGDTKKLTALTFAAVNVIEKQYPPETPIRLATMDKYTDVIVSHCTSAEPESHLLAFTYDTKGADNK